MNSFTGMVERGPTEKDRRRSPFRTPPRRSRGSSDPTVAYGVPADVWADGEGRRDGHSPPESLSRVLWDNLKTEMVLVKNPFMTRKGLGDTGLDSPLSLYHDTLYRNVDGRPGRESSVSRCGTEGTERVW